MTTREELIEVATYWLAGNRKAATEVVDAVLAKLSEDDSERVVRVARRLHGLAHGTGAWEEQSQLQRTSYLMQAETALDEAGPSVIVKHAREPDPDTSGYLDGWKARAERAEEHIHELERDLAQAEREAQENCEGCLVNKERAEKAEAKVDSLKDDLIEALASKSRMVNAKWKARAKKAEAELRRRDTEGLS